ncbi:hypothetical protein ATANTOWER_032411 [Ataeniobius toweri]|uniref:Uncharacterized protein n=1 Tax=Ataeniobius toweri TaxID=208326 RepID=A0ABU7A1D4_9TELE|nr:hypothetical protein [Ataeniobius toweri]
MCDGRIEDILKVLLPPPDNVSSLGQQLPIPTVNSVGEALLPPPKAPDSLPESLRGQLVVLLHGLTKVLPGLSFCLCHSPGRGTLGRVRGLMPRQAPQTLRPQLQAAASTIDAEKVVHSDSMSPTSCVGETCPRPEGAGMQPSHPLR